MSNPEQILLHIARGECLTEAKPEDFPLWCERFAELLCCEPRPSAIAAEISSLTVEVSRLQVMLARLKHGARPFVQAADAPIPRGIYYCEDHDNFYSLGGEGKGQGMGEVFFQAWAARRHEFPDYRALAGAGPALSVVGKHE